MDFILGALLRRAVSKEKNWNDQKRFELNSLWALDLEFLFESLFEFEASNASKRNFLTESCYYWIKHTRYCSLEITPPFDIYRMSYTPHLKMAAKSLSQFERWFSDFEYSNAAFKCIEMRLPRHSTCLAHRSPKWLFGHMSSISSPREFSFWVLFMSSPHEFSP